jgi:hypothetical protein
MRLANYFELDLRDVGLCIAIAIVIAYYMQDWKALMWVPVALLAGMLLWQVALDLLFPPRRK